MKISIKRGRRLGGIVTFRSAPRDCLHACAGVTTEPSSRSHTRDGDIARLRRAEFAVSDLLALLDVYLTESDAASLRMPRAGALPDAMFPVLMSRA